MSHEASSAGDDDRFVYENGTFPADDDAEYMDGGEPEADAAADTAQGGVDEAADDGLDDDDEGGAYPDQAQQQAGDDDDADDDVADVDEVEEEEVALSESFVFPPHVRAALAGRQSAFRPGPKAAELRLSFEALRVRPSGAAMHACKLGCAALLLPGYTEHADPGVRAAAEAFRVRDVRSRVTVARVPPGNPAHPGLGAFAAAELPPFKAVCQYGGVVLLDAEANAKQAAALATAAEGGVGAGGAGAVLTCFVDTPAGGTVIDGAPANRPRSTCSFVNDGRVGPGQAPRANNVALLPVTCPGCASCPTLLHQHMVLVTLVRIPKGAELLLDYGKAYWRLHDELIARAAALSPPQTPPPPPLGAASPGGGPGAAMGVDEDERSHPMRRNGSAAFAAASTLAAAFARPGPGAAPGGPVARAAPGAAPGGDARGAKRPRGQGVVGGGSSSAAHPAVWGAPWFRRPELDFSAAYVKPCADVARLEAGNLLWPAEGAHPPRKTRFLDARALLAPRNGLDVPTPGAAPPPGLPPLRPAAAAAVTRAKAAAVLRAASSPGGDSAAMLSSPPAADAPQEMARIKSADVLAQVLTGEPGCGPACVAELWDAIQSRISACNPSRADGASYRFHVVDFGSGPDAAWDAFGAMFAPPQRAAEVSRACATAAHAANAATGPAAARCRAAADAVVAAPEDMRVALRLAAIAFGMAWAGDDVAVPPHLCVVGLDVAGRVTSDPPLESFDCSRGRGPCGFVLRFGHGRFCALLWRLTGVGTIVVPPASGAEEEQQEPQLPEMDQAGLRAAAARERTRLRLVAAEAAREAAFSGAAAASAGVAAARETLRKMEVRAQFAQRLLKSASDERAAAAAADEAARLALTLHTRGV